MSKLTDFVNKIEASEEVPLSFSLHCQVGMILDSNNSNVNTTRTEEKVTLASELIPFMP